MKRFVLLCLMFGCLCAMAIGCGSEKEEGKETETSVSTSTTKTSDKSSSVNATATVITKNPSASNDTTQTTSPQILSEQDVKWYALFCAGTTEERISEYTCRLTYHEERQCQVYEISFKVGRTRFEYVFRATDCDIIENKKIIGEE